MLDRLLDRVFEGRSGGPATVPRDEAAPWTISLPEQEGHRSAERAVSWTV